MFFDVFGGPVVLHAGSGLLADLLPTFLCHSSCELGMGIKSWMDSRGGG